MTLGFEKDGLSELTKPQAGASDPEGSLLFPGSEGKQG